MKLQRVLNICNEWGKRKLNSSIDADEYGRVIKKLLVQGILLLLYQIFLFFFSLNIVAFVLSDFEAS